MRVSKLSIGLLAFSIAALGGIGQAISSETNLNANLKAKSSLTNAAAHISNVHGNVNGTIKSGLKAIPGQINFTPRPGKDKPVTASGAGTRGTCLTHELDATPSSLTLIVPEVSPALTATGRPTFLFYVPKTKAKQVEFRLFANVTNELGEPQTGIYRQTIELSDRLAGEAGIISYTLPAASPSLELNQSYEWSVALVCHNHKRMRDIVASGAIERVNLSDAVSAMLHQASPLQQAQIYAKDGIWYEAAAILAGLNSDQNIKVNGAPVWQTLLSSEPVNLESIANTAITLIN
jgi:hypothetical protein